MDEVAKKTHPNELCHTFILSFFISLIEVKSVALPSRWFPPGYWALKKQ